MRAVKRVGLVKLKFLRLIALKIAHCLKNLLQTAMIESFKIEPIHISNAAD
jgi:hypothetical protein